jgi:hypothetical protein
MITVYYVYFVHGPDFRIRFLGLLLRVVWYKSTNYFKELTASIITLIMNAVRSSDLSVGVTSHTPRRENLKSFLI